LKKTENKRREKEGKEKLLLNIKMHFIDDK
jgi:hypothetical protein